MATVICLDDYHSLDRKGRAREGVTALAPEAQNFDLMYEQVRHHTHRKRAGMCECVEGGHSSMAPLPPTGTHISTRGLSRGAGVVT